MFSNHRWVGSILLEQIPKHPWFYRQTVRSLQTVCASLGEIPTFLVSLCNSCSLVHGVALCLHLLWVTYFSPQMEKGLVWRERGISSVFLTSAWVPLGFFLVDPGFMATLGSRTSGMTSFQALSLVQVLWEFNWELSTWPANLCPAAVALVEQAFYSASLWKIFFLVALDHFPSSFVRRYWSSCSCTKLE